MSRLLVVANRLPVTIERRKGGYHFHNSVGGVATGLSSYRGADEQVWIGWADVPSRMDSAEREVLRARLRESHDAEPVFLTSDDVAGFYHGFSNRTLWPLFHYFSRYAEFDAAFWHSYERVNKKYRDAVLEVYQPGDRIWVQDYQLMLLPGMLRDKLPDVPIGFFLHIPFPSYELFRLLPWRRELLEGVLGASLIGFHTHDYVRHFLGSVRALLGIEDRNGRLLLGDRISLVDAFPMGVDFDRYAGGAGTPAALRERRRVGNPTGSQKIVLSIDRLDYTKGIPERLSTFDRFLERHPEWRGRVSMMCVAVPSRSRVERYRQLKREVDELVGAINGKWGTIEWTPIRYLYRSLPFNTLMGMYGAADVALVTPLRDGMNLIAKEYVAAHADATGVLVLSEMAGAARELTEALIVNPHDEDAMVAALAEALEMPDEEQVRRNRCMTARIKRYDVNRWASDFLGKLEETAMLQLAYDEYELTPEARARLLSSFEKANRRLLVLDYDGTLVGFASDPKDVKPSEELLRLLGGLASDRRNEVVIISGRDPDTLEAWLGQTGATLVAEHGIWLREPGREWATMIPVSNEWKSRVRPLLEVVVDRTPGSFVEEKEYSLAWHYRAVQTELAGRRLQELMESAGALASDLGLSILDGNKVVEFKNAGVDKGGAAFRWLGGGDHEFAMAVGDDTTDEDIFEVAPTGTWTIKVGRGPTRATFGLRNPVAVRQLLRELLEVSPPAEARRERRNAQPVAT